MSAERARAYECRIVECGAERVVNVVAESAAQAARKVRWMFAEAKCLAVE